MQRLAEVQQDRGETRAAAALYDRLDRDYPASPEALDSAARRRAMAALIPAQTPDERRTRHVRSGTALLEARQYTAALAAFRAALESKPTGADLDRVRLLLGRALIGARRVRDAEVQLDAIASGSPEAAEAAYHLAHQRARRGNITAYESVVQRFPGTPWSEEALFQLANNEQKDARDADAAPYYRRQLQDSPNGRHVERAAWRVGFYDFRSGRFEDAATLLEGVARRRDVSSSTPGFLYWAGRARAAFGQTEPARGALRRDGAPLQAQLPRPQGSRGPGPPSSPARGHDPERAAGPPPPAPPSPSPSARAPASSCSSISSRKPPKSCARRPRPPRARPRWPGSSGAVAACAMRSSR